jgi:hypothetical protein
MKALTTVISILAITGGSCFSVALYLLLSEIDFKRNAVTLNAVVVNFRGNGSGPTYVYEYPTGIKHRNTSKTASTVRDWMIGDTIPIEVDARNPTNAQIQDFTDQWFSGTVMAMMGIAFGGPGFGILYYWYRKKRIRIYLLERGSKIKANISSVETDITLNSNGRNPFVVQAEAQIDGTLYLFNSQSVWFDPSPYLKGSQVDIYYLQENPETYFMDLSFLPKHVGL